MQQQLLVDLQSLTLEGIDCSFHIDGIPQRDCCRQQRQYAGAMALIFRLSVPSFSQPAHEYRTRQRVTGLRANGMKSTLRRQLIVYNDFSCVYLSEAETHIKDLHWKGAFQLLIALQLSGKVSGYVLFNLYLIL